MVDSCILCVANVPSYCFGNISFYRFVALKMGGPIDRGQISNFSWELPMSQLKFDCKSNVINIGKIRAGIHCHRALLFKVQPDNHAIMYVLSTLHLRHCLYCHCLNDPKTVGVTWKPQMISVKYHSRCFTSIYIHFSSVGYISMSNANCLSTYAICLCAFPLFCRLFNYDLK